ncbi:hypothetical protein NDU88_006503 [Pleurodeles waltl]|uniref:Uncharacterized protein n=1 Tax=Pleurodeles waltl TaxID=8319 RepID=A0AAV7NVA8_PLEWA|nr:hypothetical protein NDU88_006503 [Pleurodeles waltl]
MSRRILPPGVFSRRDSPTPAVGKAFLDPEIRRDTFATLRQLSDPHTVLGGVLLGHVFLKHAVEEMRHFCSIQQQQCVGSEMQGGSSASSRCVDVKDSRAWACNAKTSDEDELCS